MTGHQSEPSNGEDKLPSNGEDCEVDHEPERERSADGRWVPRKKPSRWCDLLLAVVIALGLVALGAFWWGIAWLIRRYTA